MGGLHGGLVPLKTQWPDHSQALGLVLSFKTNGNEIEEVEGEGDLKKLKYCSFPPLYTYHIIRTPF